MGVYSSLMLKYIVKIFIANKRFPSEVYVFLLTDSNGAGFILCLSEMCTRFDVLLSTTKVECSSFLELDQSITLIWVLSVCVWQKNLLAFCGKLLVELVSFSMIHLYTYKQLGSGLSPQSCLYFHKVFTAQGSLMAA